MVNRVLIRIKVVQLLYSYLLTQGKFALPQSPENPTPTKRFGYDMTIDLLLLVVRLSGIRVLPSMKPIAEIDENKYLSSNKVVKMLASDSDIKSLASSLHFAEIFSDSLLVSLYNELTHTSAYRSYIRMKNRSIEDDVKFWNALLPTLFAKNDGLCSASKNINGFTIKEYEEAFERAAQCIEQSGNVKLLYLNAKKSLQKSLDKSYELYNTLLWLPIAITRLEEQRLDAARHKFLASAEDLNPNTKFVDNGMIKCLEQNQTLAAYIKSNPFVFDDDIQFLRRMLDKILESDLYSEYMSTDTTSLLDDCNFWRNVMKNIILPSDDLAEILESKSVYWNDDLDIVGTFVTKTMRKIADVEQSANFILPQFKDEEDARFGSELFVDAIDNYDTYRSYIDKFIDSRAWDTERLAFMDVVIMIGAIAELLNYPQIPIAVTLNEFIEIANSYSTPRSGQFVNGILYSVINYLKNEGLLLKN